VMLVSLTVAPIFGMDMQFGGDKRWPAGSHVCHEGPFYSARSPEIPGNAAVTVRSLKPAARFVRIIRSNSK
jgi:hypothetical protein